MNKIYDVSNFLPCFLTADIVVIHEEKILLIQRLKDPFKDHWALPGGFFDVDTDANIQSAASRELNEETNLLIEPEKLKLVGVFSHKNRDPRETIANKTCRIVSTAFMVEPKNIENIEAKDDAKSLAWYPIKNLPELAFDHADIIKSALSIRSAK